jgi:alpha-tubulin suppressor-like RCC1 family protein
MVVLVFAGAGCDKLLDLDSVPNGVKPDGALPLSSWQTATLALDHGCGIRLDGTLWCWGRNDDHQLGGAGAAEIYMPVQVGSDMWLAVSAYESHTCGLRADHTVLCWGGNQDGTLGTGSATDSMPPITVPGTWNAVATGLRTSCGIADTGLLWCWGNEDRGGVGNGQTTGFTSPVQIAGGTQFQSVAVGDEFGCALDTTGAAWCWGRSDYGQAGTASAADPQPTPIPVAGADKFTKLVAGRNTACALTTDSRLRCWGDNERGEIGDDTSNSRNTPTAVDADRYTDWIDVAAGKAHTCGIRLNGDLWCWGSNHHDQLVADTSPFAQAQRPTLVSATSGPSAAVLAGDDQTCVLDQAHTMWCAGRTGLGQLATMGSHVSPTQVGSYASASAGVHSTCAIESGGALWCWGENEDDADVGDASGLDRQLPVHVGTATWSSVELGEAACAIDPSGNLSCWGANDVDETGNPTGYNVPAPEAVLAGTHFASVSTSKHTCGIAADTLYCWGANGFGECGAMPPPAVLPASSIPLSGMWALVSTGDSHTCAVQKGGAVVQCWGLNNVGELGDGTRTDHIAPANVLLPSGLVIDKITSGSAHTCVHTSTNAVYCWGFNGFGQLGDQTRNDQSTPFLIADSWLDIAAGERSTCGIQPDHTLWCWGANEHGQIGDTTFIDRDVPTIISTDTDWVAVTAGQQHACARKQDGTLWCWGYNYHGEIGDGTAWRRDLQPIP